MEKGPFRPMHLTSLSESTAVSVLIGKNADANIYMNSAAWLNTVYVTFTSWGVACALFLQKWFVVVVESFEECSKEETDGWKPKTPHRCQLITHVRTELIFSYPNQGSEDGRRHTDCEAPWAKSVLCGIKINLTNISKHMWTIYGVRKCNWTLTLCQECDADMMLTWQRYLRLLLLTVWLRLTPQDDAAVSDRYSSLFVDSHCSRPAAVWEDLCRFFILGITTIYI